MFRNKFFTLLAGMLSMAGFLFSQSQPAPAPATFQPIADSVASYLKPLAAINVKIGIDSIQVKGRQLNIWFSKLMTDYPFRDKTVADIYAIVTGMLPQEYRGKKLVLYANGSTLEELKPAFFSAAGTSGKGGRKAVRKRGGKEGVLVENLSRPYMISDGLDGKHLAVWQSHGYYYDQPLQRWEWQRARIFQTVEDLYTQSYVLPFLVPMLENAGANVLLPRERDTQRNEVIVDNDDILGGYTEIQISPAAGAKAKGGPAVWRQGDSAGFAHPKASYLFGENPFRMGSYREIRGVKGKPAEGKYVAMWLPNIPQEGEYAVYVSYKSLPGSTRSAYYTVKHRGGESAFKVNQQMGGGTWIYLGTFPFAAGRTAQGVYLSGNTDDAGKIITADAVKFGGGMGNMARKPSAEGSAENVKSSSSDKPAVTVVGFEVPAQVSGYPRFTEGARYWLQWAGFADSVYSYSANMNDYNDDYMSRGRWVNTLSGGSRKNPDYNGLNIPVDMAFAFHSDAGTFLTDSIVGSLAIYTRYSNGSDTYPDGTSRMAARELSDLVQTQIVEDVRAAFEPQWSRRGLWDRSYAESRTPNVPSMLLELLSHQNFADMKYGLDPAFRFTVSRAIYKGIVKYFSLANGGKYTIQPLPVKNFVSAFTAGSNGGTAVRLDWSPVPDPLEPTAAPTGYVLYTRTDDGGFDNGRVVKDTTVVVDIVPNRVYSFKVVAINDGGASFPSEILSAGVPAGADPLSGSGRLKTALIINGFERVSAPASLQSKDSTLAGFYNGLDGGVPYLKDISFIGKQYEFRREIPWMDDDAPGFGASYADYEDKVIAGNTFDYPLVHGLAFMKQGYAFVSASAAGAVANKVRVNEFPVVDIILGKQAQTKTGRGVMPLRYEVFPEPLQRVIAEYCKTGGNLLVSGAYIGSDLWDSYRVTEEGKRFATDVLKYKFMTHYASTDGGVKSVANPYGFTGNFKFNTVLNDKVYAVEAADAIVPASKDAFTIFRYTENNISAGVAYQGNYRCVSLGFPIETLQSQEEIDRMIEEVVRFFEVRRISE